MSEGSQRRVLLEGGRYSEGLEQQLFTDQHGST